MKFYTVQKRCVWNKWKKQGYIQAALRKDDLFETAYLWMMEQMTNRLPNYEGECPVWLWLDKPSWYRSWSSVPRKKFVLLTLELDEKKVLFSDFDAWHVVLNEWQFDDGESWERVFDLTWVRENYLEEDEKQELQATTGRIDLNRVIDVKSFTTKKEWY